MKNLNWGIFSTGAIAKNFAKTADAMGISIYGIASRTLQSANAFAAQFNIAHAYGSYEEMVQDPAIDVIYIATPHNLHYENMVLCLTHGKHVFCEKPITVTRAEAEKAYALAAEKGLFLMEAYWTRLIPLNEKLLQLLSQNVIGTVQLAQANYGYISQGPRGVRKMDPALAGGALLDIGIYTIGYLAMLFGYAPKQITGSVTRCNVGTDALSTVVMEYENGIKAVALTAIGTHIPVEAVIYGSEGRIVIPNHKNPTRIEVILNDGTTTVYEDEFAVNGYEYEIEHAAQCITDGKLTSDKYTPAMSLSMMDIFDKLRADWEMRFPFEQ
ncbi:MAG: Gfo/Idh/MocA family oxidoreductase [Oscillospiraceae bacterium]|nr:Gfo/Idh/MocA family oxidoreductase [Oscillospiraceae bacterium]